MDLMRTIKAYSLLVKTAVESRALRDKGLEGYADWIYGRHEVINAELDVNYKGTDFLARHIAKRKYRL